MYTLLRLALLALLIASGVPDAAAQEEGRAAAQRAHSLAGDLMSPFCPGRTLADCPSPDAGAVREQIRAWIDAGVSDSDIRTRLEGNFGDRVVGLPRSAWGWAGPIVIMIVGALLLVLAMRRALRTGPAEAKDEVLDPETEARLLRELDKGA